MVSEDRVRVGSKLSVLHSESLTRNLSCSFWPYSASSDGESEKRIMRFSWSLSLRGVSKNCSRERGVWFRGTACYSSISELKLPSWIEVLLIFVIFSAIWRLWCRFMAGFEASMAAW